MLRTAVGAFDALLGRSVITKSSALGATGRQLWARQAAPRNTPMQLWTRRFSKVRESPLLRQGRPQFFSARRPFHSTKARRSQTPQAEAEAGKKSADKGPLTLRQRLKKLSREYGWAAVGVYLALSVLDFPFCFLLVRTVGTERIAEIEHVVVSNVQKFIPEGVKQWWHDYRHALKESEKGKMGNNNISENSEMVGWGVEEADERNKQSGASLATQLALAYAIHKSFIFVRVPLTAAVTPKVVKVLRSWGWEIGKRKAKTASATATASKTVR
ncbi:hypothetical protein QBC46DRAFT_458420 [Diplogelasinospora grovesii]|uniref:DUF1279 domain-containing protein n=1 Tax=Diplogelasinospora grovesii TaxID=303347 RepID=A0AAN6NBH1_9PEZI|nr:hypothetical protein QBC46DRAFT_458420 [Diplogelasinospora grovesii]